MKSKKILVGLLILVMAVGLLSACGKKGAFKIGVNQLVPHAALDASYDGFIDALKDEGYIDGEKIVIDYQNAQNDQTTLNTIATKHVNDGCDLILAISTPSALATLNATKDIPILVTAVTDPADSGLVESNEAPGGNLSGTSDLTPVKLQIELIKKLIPTAETVGVLYSSSESNSKIQVEMAIEAAEELNLKVVEATVSSTNDIEQVVQSLVGRVDVIYAPTDNTIASGMPTVAMVANPNGIPVICGEEGMVSKGGLATYGIDYYKLGWMTGKQAIKIIKGEASTATMPIEYLPDEEFSLTINEEVADQLGIEIPQDLLN
ncbi:MAG: ABC transporter substrate-binding protein [Clostridiales bacterium]|jgi:putative ABC transport system substrate-binding protein|nr:ABC transporter substrate-binding protein [Clostridiales bacterium]